MAKPGTRAATPSTELASPPSPRAGKPPSARPSSLLDTRVVYCGLRRPQSSRDNLEQLKKLPDRCVDLIYIDPPFNRIDWQSH